MCRRKYRAAAIRFVRCALDPSENASKTMASVFGNVLSLEDVAIYGGITALATFSRSELHSKVLMLSAPFRSFLELFPDVRELIADFHASRYTSALKYLEKLRPELQLDMYLSDHLSQLYDMVRSKALLQYVSPYEIVELTRMPDAFGTSVSQLQEELASLILQGQIHARIDAPKNVLNRIHTDLRARTVSEAFDVTRAACDDMECSLLRVILMKAGVTVTSAPQSLQAGSGGDMEESKEHEETEAFENEDA
mmetsp:Transcript_7549/g.13664  ORF Transcript_7549/g.13664 Transcript_7549/m.13664 type:complete len:252 (-) Transcript_7549:434-1189(-)